VNTNFVNIIKRIITEQGEDILANSQRMKGYVGDYAARESKPERLAFGRCIEHGAYTELKNTPDAGARQRVKAALAQRVHDNEGLDAALCNDALDVLEAAMFDGKNLCKNCGKELREGWGSCPFCGAGQGAEQPAPVFQPTSRVTSAAQASAAPKITPNAPTKKKHTVRNVLIAAGAIALVAFLLIETPKSNQFKYTVRYNKIIISKYIGNNTIVNIPAHIWGLPVTSI
jgi:hypothetical protein